MIASEERFLRATFPGIRRILPTGSAAGSTADTGAVSEGGERPGGFSLALYLKHREYNAGIGAALLYLSLLFLRPAFGVSSMCSGERFLRQKSQITNS